LDTPAALFLKQLILLTLSNHVYAFSRRCAGLLHFRIIVSSSERSPQLNRTTYFFTAIFLCSHDRLRRSGRDERESSNPFKMVEAATRLRLN
jgi:hypothetical protein